MARTDVFGSRITDMLSGYRIFSRCFVKSFPASSSGFETESELAIHALELRMPLAAVETPCFDRKTHSTSKVCAYKGIRGLLTLLTLIKDEQPLPFFGGISLIDFLVALALDIPLLIEYQHTHLVPRLPAEVLTAALMVISFLSLVRGLIMDSLFHARKEAKRLPICRFRITRRSRLAYVDSNSR